MIKYRFCGNHYNHESHYIHQGAKGWAGSADYICIGWSEMAVIEREE